MEKKKKFFEELEALKERGERLNALINIGSRLKDKERFRPVTFNDFLYAATKNPALSFRDIFQLFFDMINYYIPEGRDEYGSGGESVGFMHYDASRLFVDGCRNPFFADRLFANRIMNLAGSFKQRSQLNYIYLFEGPPGSGKSTFLSNLLQRFEEYTMLPEGVMYESYWNINPERLGLTKNHVVRQLDAAIVSELTSGEADVPQATIMANQSLKSLEIACPNHDHPILQIPRDYRMKFLEELIPDEEFKRRLFNTKEYEWVLRDQPCTVCKTIFDTLSEKLEDPLEVLSMLNVRKARFNRQLGEGVTVFNPGDQIIREPVSDLDFQRRINATLQTDTVKYLYSSLAKSNNGIYALMDIKENNIQRLKNLHGVISDRVHKVEFVEEYVKSLFMGLVNPEDKIHYEGVKSFQDRIITVKIPYILDYNTEVTIYKNKFGAGIEQAFLPEVLENFAKIIISTRMDPETKAIRKWIPNPGKYANYTDTSLFLLKMEIYTGVIPGWIDDEDLRGFSKDVRKEILTDSETEGQTGISGRQSINIFNAFYNTYTREGKLITMQNVKAFMLKYLSNFGGELPAGFLPALEKLYHYQILQKVKESIYDYNEGQVSRDILNYLYAINFDSGTPVVSPYTGDKLEVTDHFFKAFEVNILGTKVPDQQYAAFRSEQQRIWAGATLAREIKVQGMTIKETTQFRSLFERSLRSLKENALSPFVTNENFRRAILDFGTPSFTTYDNRLRKDVNFLIQNLKLKFGYTESGAKQICVYLIDHGLVS
jgi:predicted Ser/Thr protein kinase